jgi:hypothetical protein
MESNEAADLREQIEELRHQLASYIEARSMGEDIETILASSSLDELPLRTT